MLKAEEKEWHLIDDKGKTIDDTKLDNKILKGAIVMQTSRDGKNWTDVKCLTNAFDEEPFRNLNGISAENLIHILKRNDIKKSDAYQSGFLQGTTPTYEAYMGLKKSIAASLE